MFFEGSEYEQIVTRRSSHVISVSDLNQLFRNYRIVFAKLDNFLILIRNLVQNSSKSNRLLIKSMDGCM